MNKSKPDSPHKIGRSVPKRPRLPRRARVRVRQGVVPKMDPLADGVAPEVIDLATEAFELRFPELAQRARPVRR